MAEIDITTLMSCWEIPIEMCAFVFTPMLIEANMNLWLLHS